MSVCTLVFGVGMCCFLVWGLWVPGALLCVVGVVGMLVAPWLYRRLVEKRKQEIFEKYGFTLGKKPVTPEEMEGFKRWQRDQEAEYRERHREHITAYNREYRRRKRQEAFERAQTKWTPAQWAEWEKRQERRFPESACAGPVRCSRRRYGGWRSWG